MPHSQTQYLAGSTGPAAGQGGLSSPVATTLHMSIVTPAF